MLIGATCIGVRALALRRQPFLAPLTTTSLLNTCQAAAVSADAIAYKHVINRKWPPVQVGIWLATQTLGTRGQERKRLEQSDGVQCSRCIEPAFEPEESAAGSPLIESVL